MCEFALLGDGILRSSSSTLAVTVLCSVDYSRFSQSVRVPPFSPSILLTCCCVVYANSMLAMYVSRPFGLQLDLMTANFRLNARHSVMEKAASTNNMTVELSDLAQGVPSYNARSVRLVANLC